MESKRLTAKAFSRMDVLRKALGRGVVVMQPSNSAIFIAKEITGRLLPADVWCRVARVPKVACRGFRAHVQIVATPEFRAIR